MLTTIPAACMILMNDVTASACWTISRPPSVVSSCGAFGDERDLVGTDFQRDVLHVLGGRHLDVQLGGDGLPQHVEIAILDVPAVASQVDRDPLGARPFGDQAAASGSGSRSFAPHGW